MNNYLYSTGDYSKTRTPNKDFGVQRYIFFIYFHELWQEFKDENFREKDYEVREVVLKRDISGVPKEQIE